LTLRIDAGTRVAQLAEELRALATNGLHYAENGYDTDRYDRVMRVAAELASLVDTRDQMDIERIYRGRIELRTPLAAADAAIFDEAGRMLLVRRADFGDWCMPGGAAEVGESPSAAAVREAYEETGLRVRAKRVLGVYDNRTAGHGRGARHMYHLVFECEVIGGELLTRTHETTDARWVTGAEAAALPLFRSHVMKVPAAFHLHTTGGQADFH
jgi:ADP-ribose pyrophosphatase YjhB (NUDIX family)